jgi:UDP-N-acetylglucosamine 2-epimerase (non-hydrolysing)
MISNIASIHLCPTVDNYSNLLNEKINGMKKIVGNTVLDTINPKTDNIIIRKKVLITMHRRENHNKLERWFKEINSLAKKHSDLLEFVFPLHPNPEVQKFKHLLQNVNVIEPLNRESLIELIKESNLVISDSGGIQEECAFLNRIVIVCRTTTERPESLLKTSFLCPEPENLNDMFETNIYKIETDFECPFGDGNSSKKVVNILEKL